MLTLIKEDTLLGVAVKIYVDARSGRFVVRFGDEEDDDIRKPTMDEAITSAKAAIRRKQTQKAIEVTVYGLNKHPITGARMRTADTMPALFRGRDARNEALLLTDPASNKKFKIDRWDNGHIVRRFTPEQQAAYAELVEAKEAAESALDTFLIGMKLKKESEDDDEE